MKRITFLILSILLVLSCKSQNILNEKEVLINIKDSIVCNDKIIRTYSLPYVKLVNQKASEKVNLIVASDLKEHLNWYDSFNETKTLSENLKQFVEGNEKECGENQSPIESTYYEIGLYKKNEILSLKLSVEISAGRLRLEEYFYNFNLKDGSLLIGEDIFKSNSEELMLLINEKVKKALTDELNDFTLEEKNEIIKNNLFYNIPQWFFIRKKNEEQGIEILLNNDWEVFNMNSTVGIFLSFKELRPYLTEKIKKTSYN